MLRNALLLLIVNPDDAEWHQTRSSRAAESQHGVAGSSQTVSGGGTTSELSFSIPFSGNSVAVLTQPIFAGSEKRHSRTSQTPNTSARAQDTSGRNSRSESIRRQCSEKHTQALCFIELRQIYSTARLIRAAGFIVSEFRSQHAFLCSASFWRRS